MNKKISKFILILTVILMLSACAGSYNYRDSTDYDDGFYHWGKGKKRLDSQVLKMGEIVFSSYFF